MKQDLVRKKEEFKATDECDKNDINNIEVEYEEVKPSIK